MPKDRGAEPGDVNGPRECSLALGLVAAETRGSIAARQAAGSSHGLVLTIFHKYSDCKQIAQPECRNQTTSSLAVRESLPVSTTRSMRGRKVAWPDLCYMDDGDMMCHPILVPSFLQEFDVANTRVGAERNRLNTGHLPREPFGCSASRVENR